MTFDGNSDEHIITVVNATEDDVDAALAFLMQAGTQIVDDKGFDGTQIAGLDSWLVSEWLNGLDSLQDAFADPEVIDEE